MVDSISPNPNPNPTNTPLDPSQDLDLSSYYKRFQKIFKDAKPGQVVTRFPPEPSGHLHIGHAKAALLNYHYAKVYNGKMILRFDDTNPTKEKDEYVQSILQDLQTLGVKYDQLTHTSDYFDKLIDTMTDLITQGKCYCDNTPVDLMRQQRNAGIESDCRTTHTVDDNLKIWDKMIKGDADDYVVRGKGDMKNLNKCMRDPVFYRSSKDSHHRTGTKYKIYPTYDFACPLVDSWEGITHTMRTNEFTDRNDQYYWILDMTGLRKPTIYEYSRLNFVKTQLSKRKLHWFVNNGIVDGWNDPRFPTIKGLMRRGIQVQTIIDYMLDQGAANKNVNQTWDKLFATNHKVIDPKAPRYTAIKKDKICTLKISGGDYSSDPKVILIPAHPKNKALGDRPQLRTDELYLDHDDAKNLKVGDKITLMKWSNVTITSISPQGDALYLTGDLDEQDTDFKSTTKVTWLPKCDGLVDVDLVDYDFLMTVDKYDGDDLQSVINPKTKNVTAAYADPHVKKFGIGDIVQFERRGNFIIDGMKDGDKAPEFVFIPNGSDKKKGDDAKKDVKN